MDQASEHPVGFPIGAVARRTGLTPHVLRAWERRYGVVTPGRSAGGARMYSSEDVARLRLLRLATEAGHPIGQVAGWSVADLTALVREREVVETARSGPESDGGEAERYVVACLEAVTALDGPRIHATLVRALVALSSRAFVDAVVLPLLWRVGEMWEGEALCAAHERVLSVNLRRVLAWVMEAIPAEPGAPVLVATTPAGERHELGAMLAGVVAAEEGYRVAYLGADLPAADVAAAAAITGAEVVALGVGYGGDADAARREIVRLRALLPAEVPLLVGGRGVGGEGEALARVGVIALADLDSLRALLRARRGAATGLHNGRVDG